MLKHLKNSGGYKMQKKTEAPQGTPAQTLEDLAKIALSMGAIDAEIIDSKSIALADWVRFKCQFGCGAYGQSLTCPPYSPSAEQMRRILSGYSTALLLRLPDESIATHDIVAKLERHIFLAGYHSAIGLPAGPCERCKKCTLEQCRHPRLARPSMEACSIDVYATARKNGFAINVRKTRDDEPTYFGLVLVE
jgi:predicted metal-binding protein